MPLRQPRQPLHRMLYPQAAQLTLRVYNFAISCNGHNSESILALPLTKSSKLGTQTI
ncbi:hypothetical protein M378DRAFT_164096 [Amanita muscaria Koide BX008]|uniref:Uncharacterized protein n=1 Tax=Amanita muscaria (strain Koide BX008) TaxID=946122 RepID=A0A0C2WPU1_AMAMK|nr:hypothetical protein M378DRAFT_164096 [Amanita muscaria Koide BX008]